MENDFALGYAMGNDSNGGGSNSGGMNDGFGGGWGGLLGLIVVASLFGWGGMGGFGFGGRGGGAVSAFEGMATRADINEGFALNNITSGITGIQQGICDSTYALTNAINNGFHNSTVGMMQGFNGVERGFADISHQISDCCCGVNYNMATQFNNLQTAMCSNTRDIIDSQREGTRAILDFLTQDKIATLTAENQSLKFAASQAAQNAFITANQDAQTAELIRRLGRDCPVPAYVVPNPNCCYGNPVGVGHNGGGNCGYNGTFVQ